MWTTYKWNRVVAIANNNSIKLLLPPLIHAACAIVLPQGQSPSIVGATGFFMDTRDVFDCCVEKQKRVVAVEGEVFTDVVLGNPVRNEGSVGEAAVGKRHCNFGDIRARDCGDSQKRINYSYIVRTHKEKLTLGHHRWEFW